MNNEPDVDASHSRYALRPRRGNKNGVIYRVQTTAADGNTVELNFQQAEFGKESARYTATLQFLKTELAVFAERFAAIKQI